MGEIWLAFMLGLRSMYADFIEEVINIMVSQWTFRVMNRLNSCIEYICFCLFIVYLFGLDGILVINFPGISFEFHHCICDIQMHLTVIFYSFRLGFCFIMTSVWIIVCVFVFISHHDCVTHSLNENLDWENFILSNFSETAKRKSPQLYCNKK